MLHSQPHLLNTLLLFTGFFPQGTAYIYCKLFITLREQSL